MKFSHEGNLDEPEDNVGETVQPPGTKIAKIMGGGLGPVLKSTLRMIAYQYFCSTVTWQDSKL